MVPAGNGSGYLNEVSPLTVRPVQRIPRRLIGSVVGIPLLPDGRHRPARRRAESLLGSALSRRVAHDAGLVQAVDPRPAGLVQQLHGRLLGLRPNRRPDRRQAALRDAHPQDRRPSRSCAAGPRPSPAHLARLEAGDSRPAANGRRSPRDVRRGVRVVQRERICAGNIPDGLRSPPHGAHHAPRGPRGACGVRCPGCHRRFPDPCDGRRSCRQWPPGRGTVIGVLGALGGDPHRKERRPRRAGRRLRRANRGVHSLHRQRRR